MSTLEDFGLVECKTENVEYRWLLIKHLTSLRPSESAEVILADAKKYYDFIVDKAPSEDRKIFTVDVGSLSPEEVTDYLNTPKYFNKNGDV